MEDIKKHNLTKQTRTENNTTEFEPSNKVEIELGSSNEFFNNIFNSCLDGILVGDPDGYITMVNEAATQILGYSKDEMIGKHPLELGITPQEEKESGRDVIENLLVKGSLYGLNRRWIKKDGTSIDIEMNLSLMKDKNDNIIGSVGSFRDITDHKRVEQKVRIARDNLENIIESSLDSIVVTDDKGHLTNVNYAFLELLGFSKTEVIGKHMSEFAPMNGGTYECSTGELMLINEEFADQVKSNMLLFREKGRMQNAQSYLLRKDNKIVPVEDNIVCLLDKEGKRIGAVAITRDITERRKAEKEIKQTKDYLENTFRTSVDGVMIADSEGKIVAVNKSVEKMFDCSSDLLVGKYAPEMRFFEEEEEFQITGKELMDRLLGEGTISGVERTWKKPDGTALVVEMNIALLKDDEGNMTGSVASIRDITARKQAEETLKESEEKYHNLIEHANDAIVSINTSGMIIGFNKKAEEIFGYSREEVMGKPSYLLISPPNKEIYKKALKQFAKTGTGIDIGNNIVEGSGRRKEGEELQVEYSYYTINVKGEVLATAIIRDISKRKEEEKKIIKYQEQLKSLTTELILSEQKERQHFADFLHDEIGQQLFAARMQLEQLKDSLSTAQNTKKLNNAINYIKRVIDQSRSLTFELSSPVLKQLGFEKALEWLVEKAHRKYDIIVTLEDDKQEKPLDDDVKILLYQAVSELLANVAKHAKTKNASVSVNKDNSNIRICLKDNGVGFVPPNQSSSDAKIEGFGLFRIKERLEQLGGQIEIKSQPNRGTQVTLVAPLFSSV